MSMRISRLNIWATILEMVIAGRAAAPENHHTVDEIASRHNLKSIIARRVLVEMQDAGLIVIVPGENPRTVTATEFGASVQLVFISSQFLSDSLVAQQDRKRKRRYLLHD